MYIVNVTLSVKPEFAEKFIEATIDNASNTRREPGNIRFDVSRADDDPNRFMLYEVYKAKDDFMAHQQTAHYARWRDAVTPWMLQPRQSLKYVPLFFGNERV
jgi:autoinducer 2-degrading protein